MDNIGTDGTWSQSPPSDDYTSISWRSSGARAWQGRGRRPRAGFGGARIRFR